MTRRQSLFALSALAVAPCALACRKRAVPPDQRIRTLLASLEAAVEAGDVAPVREALAPLFSGNDNMDKQALLALLALRLRSQKQLFVLTRILDVEATPGQLAAAELLVAVAAVPIPGPEALPHLEADVLRLQIALQEDPEGPQGYRVKSAAWSPARWPL